MRKQLSIGLLCAGMLSVVGAPVVAQTAPITAANAKDLAVVEEYADYVWLDFSSDGDSIAMQGDKLAVLDRASGELRVLVDEVVGQNYVTAMSPDARYILYVTDNDEGASVSRVWDAEAGEVAADLQSAGAGAVFVPDSAQLIVAGTELYGMDVSTGDPLELGIESRSTSEVIDLMPDGSTLVTSSNGHVVFDSTESGEEIKTWDYSAEFDGAIHTPNVTGVSVSPDGAVVVVGIMSSNHPELNAIHVMDFANDEPLRVIPYELIGETPALREVALSPDGSLVVAAFQEDLLRGGHLDAFDVGSGELIGRIPVQGAAQRIGFSPDGTLLAVGTTRRSGLKIYALGEG